MKISILLALVLFISPPLTESVKLEYTFKIGDEYTMDQITNQTMKQTIMGTDQSGENHYSGTMILKVVSVTSTGARVETQFISLKNTSKTVMGETIMDSNGPEDNVQNKVFKAMMKKPFHIAITKLGRVEKVEGADNLWSDMGNLGIDETTLATLKQSLSQMLGENSLKSSFEQALIVYPDRKVKVGETWSSQNGFPMEFPILVDNTWTLVDAVSSSAVINANGVFTTTDKTKAISLPGGFKATVDLTGKQNMKASVNPKSGWPNDLNINSVLTGKMTLLAGGMLPQDMEVPMEIKTETAFKFIKKK